MSLPGGVSAQNATPQITDEYGYPIGVSDIESYPVWTDSPATLTALVPTATPDYALTEAALPTSLPPRTLSPDEFATLAQFQEDNGGITMVDNGGDVTITLGSRFYVFLDDKHPVRELTCEPTWVMGYISNGSSPDGYPRYFEATVVGTCKLINGDFAIDVVVVESIPESN